MMINHKIVTIFGLHYVILDCMFTHMRFILGYNKIKSDYWASNILVYSTEVKLT